MPPVKIHGHCQITLHPLSSKLPLAVIYTTVYSSYILTLLVSDFNPIALLEPLSQRSPKICLATTAHGHFSVPIFR